MSPLVALLGQDGTDEPDDAGPTWRVPQPPPRILDLRRSRHFRRYLFGRSSVLLRSISRSEVVRHPFWLTLQSISTVWLMSTGYRFSMNSSVFLNERADFVVASGTARTGPTP